MRKTPPRSPAASLIIRWWLGLRISMRFPSSQCVRLWQGRWLKIQYLHQILKVGSHVMKVHSKDRKDMQAAANLGQAVGRLYGKHTGADGGLPSQHQWWSG